jgi:DeoR family transcriptional regulator of aga operon
MLNEERRGKILDILRDQGIVRVKDLSKQFDASEVTIRNDLNELQQRGLLRRAHGGAMLAEEPVTESPFQERLQAHAVEKSRISIAAAELIGEGETVILDSGTTTQEIARRIKTKQNLRVITNGVNIAMELLGVRGLQVIIVGGTLREDSFSVVGHFAEQMLNQFSADKLFIGAAGCDVEFGLSTPTLEEARVNQAMIRSAREKILVTDSSKFGYRSFTRIASLFEMDKIITDTALPEEWQREIKARGVELILV